MTRRRRYLLWGGELLVLLTVLAMLLPLEAQGANGFASPAFEAQWRSVEGAVPNFWGPVVTAREGQREAYAEGTYNGEPGQRLVQYFDKARMEQTASGGNVTNGLLTVELKTGALQLGNSAFQQYTGAAVGLAGDVGAPGPTYAALTQLPDKDTQQSGAVATTYTASTNTFTTGVVMTDPNMVFASYLADPSGRYGQNIPKAFADFLARIPGGSTPAMGYPISPAFQANVRVNGVENVPVVIQAFERKVLTYTPSNATAFQVEFGNIGQHYYQWRYVTIPGGGNATTVPLAPFATADSTGIALTATRAAQTATAYSACASPTAIGAVGNSIPSGSVLPVCAATGTAYVDPNSTAYARTVTADARVYNATSTAIYAEYNGTSTAIANENTTYNATSTAIYRDYYATGTASAVAATASAREYDATSTAFARVTSTSIAATNTTINATNAAIDATNTAIDNEVAAAARASTPRSGQQTPTSMQMGVTDTTVTATYYASLTATANGIANGTAQAIVNATGTAAATQGTINNNPSRRQSGPTIPPTPANAQTATAAAQAAAQTVAAQAATAQAAQQTATAVVKATATAQAVGATNAAATAANVPNAAPPLRRGA